MVEFALILPMFLMVLVGIIVLGMGIYYQQQVTNAAREGARYAAVHSASAQCPTVSTLSPTGTGAAAAAYVPLSYYPCDRPEDGWPRMKAAALSKVVAMGPVHIVACWSGYRDDVNNNYDAPPDGTVVVPSAPPVETHWAQCLIDGKDPTTADLNSIPCSSGLATTDQASSMSEKPGVSIANRVTVYACYLWTPPMAGFILIPSTIPLRAAVTEAIQRQQ